MKRLKASFTIEAAVIIPLSMMVMVWIFFLAFYLHDRVIINCSGTDIILENIKESVNSEDMETVVKDRMIIANDVSVRTEEDGNDSVSIEGTFRLPDMIAGSGISGSNISMSALSPRSEILKYKAVADGVTLLTGDDEDEN